MSKFRNVCLTAFLVALGCLVTVHGPRVTGGEKKKEADGKVLFGKVDSLTADDEKDTKPQLSKSARKLYKVKLEEGKAYRIDLASKDFDTFLRLEDPAGKEVAFNDDIDLANKILDSRIIYVAPKTGEYRIIVTTYDPGKTGLFTLEMIYASDAEAKEARFLSRVARIGEAPLSLQKELVAEVIKVYQAKGEKLNLKDAQLAAGICLSIDESDAAFAKQTCQTLGKLFESSEDKRAVGLSKFLESVIKNLDKLGKEIEISGKTTDGKEFDLKNLKGKVVLVDFWATWCGPCIVEIPNIQEAYKKYHGKGFEVIGVSLDRPGKEDVLAKFIEDKKLPWRSINIEDSRKLADKYQVNAIPYPVLVDQTGRIVSLRARGPQLERLLERLLGEKK